MQGISITYECLMCQSVSQSLFCQVLNAVSDDVFRKKCLMLMEK